MKRSNGSTTTSHQGTTEWERVYISVFSPAMLQIAQHCVTHGTFFEDLGLGIINSVPKVAGSCVIAKLRPIALQAVKKSGSRPSCVCKSNKFFNN